MSISIRRETAYPGKEFRDSSPDHLLDIIIHFPL
jgi:hypothetical protein